MNAIKCLIPTLIVLCLLDFIWLNYIAKPLYLKQLGALLNMKNGQLETNLIAAVIVYLLLTLMIWFVVLPLANNQIALSFIYGALLGFIVYGVYDMTNLAILKGWPLTISLIDWGWGVIVCSTVSGFCSWLKNYIYS